MVRDSGTLKAMGGALSLVSSPVIVTALMHPPAPVGDHWGASEVHGWHPGPPAPLYRLP